MHAIETMSEDQITELELQIAQARETQRRRRLSEALERIELIVTEEKLPRGTLVELIGKLFPRKEPKNPPLYFHPTDGSKSWSGFGKQPAWIVEHLAAGKDLGDLRAPLPGPAVDEALEEVNVDPAE